MLAMKKWKKWKEKREEQEKSPQGTPTDLTSSPNGEKVKSTHTDKEFSDIANVSEKTYRMEAKILNSNNEDIK